LSALRLICARGLTEDCEYANAAQPLHAISAVTSPTVPEMPNA